jgi:hypothetical protein
MHAPKPKAPQHFLAFFAATVIIGGAVVVLMIMMVGQDKNKREAVSPNPSSTPEITALPTITPTPTPTDLPSPSPTVTLPSLSEVPQSAVQYVESFYAIYKAEDRKKLEAFFSLDTSNELISLRSRLFTGFDNNGLPGGPTLFDTSSASQKPFSFTITSKKVVAGKVEVVVSETRTDLQTGETLPVFSTKLLLIPTDATQKNWLIESYTKVGGSTGKYDAFLKS